MRLKPVVSVQIPAPARMDEKPLVRHLLPGQSVTLGTCVCSKRDLDIPLPLGLWGPVAGRVKAYNDHWRIDNLSDGRKLVIEDLENSQHLVTVPAARAEVVMPFELTRVRVLDSTIAIVYGPEPATATVTCGGCPATAGDATARLLDRSTVYYSVLLALCEPRLRGMVDAPLPTSAEIARRLQQLNISISPVAVDSHVAYLVDKLDLRVERNTGGKRSWRKEKLVDVAIRHGLIDPEDLPD